MKKLRHLLLSGFIMPAYMMPWLTLGAGHFRRGTLIVKRTKATFAGQEIDVDEVVR